MAWSQGKQATHGFMLLQEKLSLSQNESDAKEMCKSESLTARSTEAGEQTDEIGQRDLGGSEETQQCWPHLASAPRNKKYLDKIDTINHSSYIAF